MSRPPIGRNAKAGQNVTKREQEVIELLLEGHNNESISYRLGIKPITAREHVYRIFIKHGVNTRLDFAVTILKQRHAEEIARIHQSYTDKEQ